jgi:hypothetical protein
MWQDWVEGILGGSAQPGANAKQFADFEIFLPPLPERAPSPVYFPAVTARLTFCAGKTKPWRSWRKRFIVISLSKSMTTIGEDAS